MTEQEQPPTIPEDDAFVGESGNGPLMSNRPLSNQQIPKRPSWAQMQRGISQMPTQFQEKQHVAEVHGHESRRAKLLNFLHSKPVQYTLMALLLLDVLFLFIEMFLSAEFPMCHIVQRDATSCCPECPTDPADRFLAEAEGKPEAEGECTIAASEHDAAAAHDRYLAEEGGHHAICEAGIDTPQCEAGCDNHKWQAVHTLEEVLFWCTIGILSIFLVELICMIVCVGPRTFFSKFFYALDFFIVSVSLVLEIVFHIVTAGDVAMESIVGLLVLLRVWRFVRIGHGLVEVTHELSTEKYDEVMDYLNSLESILEANGIPIPECSDSVRKIVDKSHHSH